MNIIKNNKVLIFSIISLAIPAIIEMSLHTLVGVADTLMISRFLGNEALAASGYANQIVFTITFIFASFNIGAVALISRSYGAKDYKKVNAIAGQNIVLNTLIGLIISILTLFFTKDIINIFKSNIVVRDLGTSYLNIVSYSLVFLFISFASAACLRGIADNKTPMVVTGIVNVLNIVGNYALLSGFWIFPQMGIEGAALATSISRGIGAIIYIIFLVRSRGFLKLKLQN